MRWELDLISFSFCFRQFILSRLVLHGNQSNRYIQVNFAKHFSYHKREDIFQLLDLLGSGSAKHWDEKKKKLKKKQTPLNSFFQQFQNKLYQHRYKTKFQPLRENTRPPWNSCQICKPLLPTTQAAPGLREAALFHARCCCLPWMKSWGSRFLALNQLKDWTDSGLPFNRLLT